MNRLPHIVANNPPPPPTSDPYQVDQAVIYGARDADQHALFVPLHYEPNYAYPLLVWLHGPDDDQRQLQRLMPHISMRNYAAVGVRGTVSRSAAATRPTYSWSQADSNYHLAEQAVFESIQAALAKFHVAPERVFIGGFDCGGTMALRLALEHPDQFAGVLSLGGAFPHGHQALRRLHEARKLPVFLACGRDSQAYQPERISEDLRLLYSAGMSVALRLYPCGHEITTHMLADMDRWMMEQVETIKLQAAVSTT